MILYFTGTGNSEYVAREISKCTEDSTLNLLERIKGHDYSPVVSDRAWVVVCPTYSWRIPKAVENILEKTELKGSREVYFILTCGGDIGNAGHYAEKLCRDIGKEYMGIAEIVMPENFINMFDVPEKEEALRIIYDAGPEIDAAARLIKAGKKLPSHCSGPIDMLKSSIVNRMFYKHFMGTKEYTVSDECTGCGFCEKNCPAGCICIENGKPIWKDEVCFQCQACISHCPQKAIEYGKKSLGKPRYVCPGFISNS